MFTPAVITRKALAEVVGTKKTNAAPPTAEKWECDAIGDFLLELYHRQVISTRTDWHASKRKIRDEFADFLEKTNLREKFWELNIGINIGTQLRRTNFLINTARNCDHFRIKNIQLFFYRNQKLAEFDEKCKNNDLQISALDDSKSVSTDGKTAVSVFDVSVETNGKSYPLKYQGAFLQSRNTTFHVTNFGCYICQLNFATPDEFEQHVEYHGDESDFESLKNLVTSDTSLLKLSYKISKNLQYMCFTIVNNFEDIVIDKIIIVQSHSMQYVHNNRVPYDLPANSKDTFFVNLHQFALFVEYPIVIAFHSKNDSDNILMEQHHLMRTEDFPINMPTSPCRLHNKKIFKPTFKLPQYGPTPESRKALKSGTNWVCHVSANFSDYVTNKLTFTPKNMREAMHILLQLEDIDSLEAYRKLVQCNVKLRHYGGQVSGELKSGNQCEKVVRPFDEVIIVAETSSIPNDELYMMNADELAQVGRKHKMFFGRIERISQRRVTFECDQKIPDDFYRLIFRPERRHLRHQYRALELLKSMECADIERFLFPQIYFTPRFNTYNNLNLKLIDENIGKNPEQLQAVQNIVRRPPKEATYVIFGPPGTGKTTTIVEAILQLYLCHADTKMLITAGSNSACDEIALRLCKALESLGDTSQVFTRIYSRTSENRKDNINDLLLESSNLYGTHFYPDIEMLHEYRMIVCTLGVIGKLSTGGFGKNIIGEGVFTHLFVDEAAASTEAETLVGIVTGLSRKSHLIISGDHKQLGPILSSTRAQDLGLGVSLMDRLLARDCYAVDSSGNYNRNIQTRLCRNYRSHPRIVSLYSQMYYNNELLGLARLEDVSLVEKWHRAPNPNYPIIFHSVFGSPKRENNSTSMSNFQELEVVMDYVKDLMCFGINGQKISQTDIGIISPYKKQYQYIQEELNLRNWSQIETGSVEIFQGKEKQIIIVSFVRSFTSTLGFLDNPRRLNVTLSRPKSLLILIGNPKTLSMNPDFNHIINECQLNKTMVGATIFNDEKKGDTTKKGKPNAENNMTKLMEKTNLNQNTENKDKQRTKREWHSKKIKNSDANTELVAKQKQNAAQASSNPVSTKPRSQNKTPGETIGSKEPNRLNANDLRNLEGEIRERMRKLQITPPAERMQRAQNNAFEQIGVLDLPRLKKENTTGVSNNSVLQSTNSENSPQMRTLISTQTPTPRCINTVRPSTHNQQTANVAGPTNKASLQPKVNTITQSKNSPDMRTLISTTLGQASNSPQMRTLTSTQTPTPRSVNTVRPSTQNQQTANVAGPTNKASLQPKVNTMTQSKNSPDMRTLISTPTPSQRSFNTDWNSTQGGNWVITNIIRQPTMTTRTQTYNSPQSRTVNSDPIPLFSSHNHEIDLDPKLKPKSKSRCVIA